MADTTVEKVLAIAPHLGDLPESTVQMYIDDAIEELSSTSLADSERAQRYLAAHLGTLNVRRATSEKVGDIKVDYPEGSADAVGLNLTSYGREYARLLGNEKGLNFRLFS